MEIFWSDLCEFIVLNVLAGFFGLLLRDAVDKLFGKVEEQREKKVCNWSTVRQRIEGLFHWRRPEDKDIHDRGGSPESAPEDA